VVHGCVKTVQAYIANQKRTESIDGELDVNRDSSPRCDG
jgi:hypothetical protein